MAALGSQSGTSKSPVSRICQDIDAHPQAFLARPLESSEYGLRLLDATYLKGRLGKAQQDCCRAAVVAMGVKEDGRRRELLGLKVGLVGEILLEQHEHWQLEGRRMVSAESMAAIPDLDDIPALLSASA